MRPIWAYFAALGLRDDFLEGSAYADDPAQEELESLVADGGILLPISIQNANGRRQSFHDIGSLDGLGIGRE